MTSTTIEEHPVRMPIAGVTLDGDLVIPHAAHGIVIFAHGSGSSRHSSRNRFVAHELQAAGLSTLLMDLLTKEEERIDSTTAHLRFDIGLLAQRLVGAKHWVSQRKDVATLPVGYFGASTDGGAALVAAAADPAAVEAVVSRGGRPDLAGNALPHVKTPTLLIVGGNDEVVIGMNERAMAHMRCEKKLVIVPGATHLFEEPGTLEAVAHLAREWFQRHLIPAP